MTLASVINEDDQIRLLVAALHPGNAVPQRSALAGNQGCGTVEGRLGGTDIALQSGHITAEHAADIARAIFTDGHPLAVDRNATPCLVIAIVAHTAIGTRAAHQQGVAGISTHELLMAAVRSCSNTLSGRQRPVLLLQLIEIALM